MGKYTSKGSDDIHSRTSPGDYKVWSKEQEDGTRNDKRPTDEYKAYYTLSSGWNYISFPSQIAPTSTVASVFADYSFVTKIQTFGTASLRQPDGTWTGSITTLYPDTGYEVFNSGDKIEKISIVGTQHYGDELKWDSEVSSATHLTSGNNLIATPYWYDVPIDEAIAFDNDNVTLKTSGVGSSAGTATVTFTGQPSATQTIILISEDGTSKTYTAVAGTPDYTLNQFSLDTASDAVALSLENAIEHASGHNGKKTV